MTTFSLPADDPEITISGAEFFTMNEVNRLKMIQDVIDRRLTTHLAAERLWIPHTRRQHRIYQPWYRRDCLGELIQIDGSHHDWFEGRAPKCCLLVYVDDASGRLIHLRFCQSESAFDYMMATRDYIDKHGKPVAFYSDKHAVFRAGRVFTHGQFFNMSRPSVIHFSSFWRRRISA